MPPRARPGARILALHVLERCLGPNAEAADSVFQVYPRLDDLAPRERAFAMLLYTTVLRRLAHIDHILRRYLKRRPRQLAAMNILRLGAAQLLYLGTEPHAAVGETVELAKSHSPETAGLTNAILRRLVGMKIDDEADFPANAQDWLYASWQRAYGDELARKIDRAHRIEPPLDLSCKEDAEGWAIKLGGDHLAGGTIRLGGHPRVAELEGYGEGAWWVQDLSAALPVRLIGDVRGLRALDMCAAPGGKTAQLVAGSAAVVALDRSRARCRRLSENLKRLGMTAEVKAVDASEYEDEQGFDLILLDAPCTATGTIRRHPDIAWTKKADEVERLVAVQRRLLEQAVRLLRPGGSLVYAVCSLQPEECDEQVADLLARHHGLSRAPFTSNLAKSWPDILTPLGDLRSLPCHMADHGGMDGFYAAHLKKGSQD